MISELANEKIFWTRKMNLNLVKFIKSKPHIWNPKHPKYTSVKYRDKTYAEFAAMYGNEFSGHAVKHRWTNIRSTFANYLRKVKASRANPDSEEYKVNWHLWEPCQFLIKVNRKKVEHTSATSAENGDSKLNPERGSNRRMPEQIDSICQPFDSEKFNFTKASTEEIIFSFKENNDSDIHTVLVNVSPINRYHSLLCPSIKKCLPQVVTKDSLRLCLEIMCSAKDRNLRIGFNSLCGFASVNHLHYHLFLISHDLVVEKAQCRQLRGSIYCLDNCPVPALCFEVQSQPINEVCEDIYKLLEYFLKNSIAHNIFITRGSKVKQSSGKVAEEVLRVVVWPRKTSAGAKPLGAFNVALCELSGWFPIFTKHDFENLTKEDLEKELTKWKIDEFDKLCESVK